MRPAFEGKARSQCKRERHARNAGRPNDEWHLRWKCGSDKCAFTAGRSSPFARPHARTVNPSRFQVLIMISSAIAQYIFSPTRITRRTKSRVVIIEASILSVFPLFMTSMFGILSFFSEIDDDDVWLVDTLLCEYASCTACRFPHMTCLLHVNITCHYQVFLEHCHPSRLDNCVVT